MIPRPWQNVRTLTSAAGVVLLATAAGILSPRTVRAQQAVSSTTTTRSGTARRAESEATADTSRVIVTGEELPSAYGAPPAFSRTRFAPTTTAYVLPPGSGLVATIFEGTANRHDKPGYMLTQEVEMGLPYRFGFAVETSFEHFDDESQLKP